MSAPRCPQCQGELWCDRRLGLLSRHADECSIGREEVEQAADDRVAYGATTTQSPRRGFSDGRMYGKVFVRSIVASEVALLVAAGADPAAAARAQVGVLFIAGGIRRRTFSSVQVSSLPGVPLVDPRLVP